MRKIRSIIAALAVMAPLSLASVFTSCDKDVKVSEVQIQPAEVTLGIGETQPSGTSPHIPSCATAKLPSLA